MIRSTSKVFFFIALILVSGFQVFAQDSKDKKIEQLETLLQLYIEENLAIKNEIKVLKS